MPKRVIVTSKWNFKKPCKPRKRQGTNIQNEKILQKKLNKKLVKDRLADEPFTIHNRKRHESNRDSALQASNTLTLPAAPT